MGRLTDGVDDRLEWALNLNAYNKVFVSGWLWTDSTTNDDDVWMEHGPNYNTSEGFLLNPGDSGTGAFTLGTRNVTPSALWSDSFPRPSDGVWHNISVWLDKSATPVNRAWVDGVAQTLTTLDHTAGGDGDNFLNSSLYVMHRNGGGSRALFLDGRTAEIGIWGGVELIQEEISALAGGYSPWLVRPQSLLSYVPLHGVDSPEPAWVGSNATVTGAIATNHPPVRYRNPNPVHRAIAPHAAVM